MLRVEIEAVQMVDVRYTLRRWSRAVGDTREYPQAKRLSGGQRPELLLHLSKPSFLEYAAKVRGIDQRKALGQRLHGCIGRGRHVLLLVVRQLQHDRQAAFWRHKGQRVVQGATQ